MSNTGCRYVRDKLFDYLEGNLDNEIASCVKAHLDTCQVCRKELERCRASLAMLASAKVEPPADFTARVMERIAESGDSSKAKDKKAKVLFPRKALPQYFGTLVAAAALVLAVAAGWRILPAFMKRTDSAGSGEATAAEHYSAAADKAAPSTAEETLAGERAAETGGDILMFSLPEPEDEPDDSVAKGFTAPPDTSGTTDEQGGYSPGYRGEAEIPGKMMLVAPSADELIKEYAPKFLGKASQVAIIRTEGPIDSRPAASESVYGEGYAAYLIEGDAAFIAEAEQRADEFGGIRYGEPGTPMVWIEIYG